MDCNKTIDFMKELNRMCDELKARCIDCPIEYTEMCEKTVYGYVTDDFTPERLQEIIEKIQKWSNEHPQKTYADDFFEKFPNAERIADRIPIICRRSIYGGECDKGKQCPDCWNEPMEE